VTLIDVHDLARLMRMEYSEMPDLSLTRWQAQRLWSASREDCERALALLLASGFLRETTEGRFVRCDAFAAGAAAGRRRLRSA
jgi:hypothetical protein